jgi:hypothetical protein
LPADTAGAGAAAAGTTAASARAKYKYAPPIRMITARPMINFFTVVLLVDFMFV